jgi:hypothetical protein
MIRSDAALHLAQTEFHTRPVCLRSIEQAMMSGTRRAFLQLDVVDNARLSRII